jgi:hypothetical protein
MAFEDIAIRVADEQGSRAIREGHRATAEGDPRSRQSGLHGIEIADRQGDMGKARMLLGDIHQDIWGRRIRRIENEIDHDPRRVRQNSDGFRTHRSHDELEAQRLVKLPGARQVMDANTEMGETGDEGVERHGVGSKEWNPNREGHCCLCCVPFCIGPVHDGPETAREPGHGALFFWARRGAGFLVVVSN